MVNVDRQQAETAVVIVSWFALNTSIGTITKWTYLYGKVCVVELTGARKCQIYNYPIAITTTHMLFSWALCGLYLSWRQKHESATEVPQWSLKKQFATVGPLAVSFALSVAMGNLALKYVYPSFTQMLGGMGPIITVVIAVLVMGKRYNHWTWISMPIICGGLAICTSGEVNFHILGVLYALGSTVLRSVKSLIQAQLLVDKVDSVTLLYLMAPWSAAFLIVASLALEGSDPIAVFAMTNPNNIIAEQAVEGIPALLFLLVLGGLTACLLNIANFLVTSYTSALTLQVLGNMKSCFAIGTSAFVLGNEVTLQQGLGVVLCLGGVWLYQSRGGAVQVKQPPPLMPVEPARIPSTKSQEMKDLEEDISAGDSLKETEPVKELGKEALLAPESAPPVAG